VELPYLREEQPRLRRCRRLILRGRKLSVAAAIGHKSPNIVTLDDDNDVRDAATIMSQRVILQRCLSRRRSSSEAGGALLEAASTPQQIQAG